MSYNGDNVPDDLRYSDHWDDNEVLCPVCGTEMERPTALEDCECGKCGYILFDENDWEPDNDEW